MTLEAFESWLLKDNIDINDVQVTLSDVQETDEFIAIEDDYIKSIIYSVETKELRIFSSSTTSEQLDWVEGLNWK